MNLPGMTMYISGFSDSSLYTKEIASEETIGVTNLRNSGYWLVTKEEPRRCVEDTRPHKIIDTIVETKIRKHTQYTNKRISSAAASVPYFSFVFSPMEAHPSRVNEILYQK